MAWAATWPRPCRSSNAGPLARLVAEQAGEADHFTADEQRELERGAQAEALPLSAFEVAQPVVVVAIDDDDRLTGLGGDTRDRELGGVVDRAREIFVHAFGADADEAVAAVPAQLEDVAAIGVGEHSHPGCRQHEHVVEVE